MFKKERFKKRFAAIAGIIIAAMLLVCACNKKQEKKESRMSRLREGITLEYRKSKYSFKEKIPAEKSFSAKAQKNADFSKTEDFSATPSELPIKKVGSEVVVEPDVATEKKSDEEVHAELERQKYLCRDFLQTHGPEIRKDPGQTVGKQLEEVEQLLLKAEEAQKNGKPAADALVLYQQISGKIDWLVNHGLLLRKEVRSKIEVAEQTRKSMQSVSAAKFAPAAAVRAEQLLSEGHSLYEKGQFSEALKKLNESISSCRQAILAAGKHAPRKLLAEAQLAEQAGNWKAMKSLAAEVRTFDATEAELKQAEALIIRAEKLEKIEQIDRLLKEAEEHRKARNWGELLAVADKIRIYDPGNAHISALKKEADAALLQQQIKARLAEAEEAKKGRKWEQVVALTDQILKLEPGNDPAKKLAEEARLELLPRLQFRITFYGKEQPVPQGAVKIRKTGTPDVWTVDGIFRDLESGINYTAELSFTENGRTFAGKIDFECNWTQLKVLTIPFYDDDLIKDKRDGIRYDQDDTRLTAIPESCYRRTYGVPYGVKAIAPGAFQSSSLQEVVIPDWITELPAELFADTPELQKLSIPAHFSRKVLKGLKIPYPCQITIRGEKPQIFLAEELTIDMKTSEDGRTLLHFSPSYVGKSFQIPEDIRTVAAKAFQHCLTLEEVICPPGLETIGAEAFANCPNLKRIRFGGNEKKIGKNTFQLCHKLKEVHLPDSLTELPSGMFRHCRSLTEIKLPAGLISIGANAFTGCTTLTALELPETLQHIGYGAFQDCYNLKALDLPLQIGKLPEYFLRGSGVISVTLPQNLKKIGTHAFSGCRMLRQIQLPSQLEEIEDRAFEDCTSLDVIVLPATLKKIGAGAFTNCSSLKEIALPFLLEEIGSSAFSGVTCPVRIGMGAPYFAVDSKGILSHKKEKVLIRVPPELKGSCSIPFGIVGIDPGAFRNCNQLTEINLPFTLKWIGKQAFSGCSKLNKIVIPNSISDAMIRELDLPYYCRIQRR